MKHLSTWAGVLCVSIAYSLVGCAGIASEAPLRSGSHLLAEHGAVNLTAAVSVRYDRFSDSRCPTGAMCIWAGKVSYHFIVSSRAGIENFSLDYEGDTFASKTLPGVSFGISFAAVRERPVAEHAVVLEVAVTSPR